MTLFCPNCGAANEEFAQYCASCGEDLSTVQEKQTSSSGTASTTATGTDSEKKLYKSRYTKMISGVSGGLAKYFGMDVNMVRILWILAFSVTGGALLVAYIVLAAMLEYDPEEPELPEGQEPPQ